jgi:hypothetical protein
MYLRLTTPHIYCYKKSRVIELHKDSLETRTNSNAAAKTPQTHRQHRSSTAKTPHTHTPTASQQHRGTPQTHTDSMAAAQGKRQRYTPTAWRQHRGNNTDTHRQHRSTTGERHKHTPTASQQHSENATNTHRQHRSSTEETTPQTRTGNAVEAYEIVACTKKITTHGEKQRHIARHGRMRGMPEISIFGKSHRHPNPIQRSGKEDMDNVWKDLHFVASPILIGGQKDKHIGRVTTPSPPPPLVLIFAFFGM